MTGKQKGGSFWITLDRPALESLWWLTDRFGWSDSQAIGQALRGLADINKQRDEEFATPEEATPKNASGQNSTEKLRAR